MENNKKLSPEKINVQPGTVAWCTCSKSKTQPYCDGSHAGTDKKPFVEKIEKSTDMFICACGKSTNTPFCDGSHNTQNNG